MNIQVAEPVYDNYEEQKYDDKLYSFDNIADGVESLDRITDGHVSYYHENGFLAVQKAFSETEIEFAVDGVMSLINGDCPEFLVEQERGMQFEKSQRDILDTLSVEKRRDAVRKLQDFVGYDQRLKAIAEQSQFLDVVEMILGHKPELFQDQALLKPPGIGREKPWHQDHGFFNLPMGTPIVGCWIALDKAIPSNGCMHVKPGTHKEGPKIHHIRRDWQICDTDLDLSRDVMVPLNPGGLLFFDGLIHHGTPANRSSLRRRALQFHYIPQGTPRTTDEERMEIFGSEGKDVTC